MPALVTAGFACIGPLLPVLDLPVEATDVGLCLSVAVVLYAVGAGLGSRRACSMSS